MTAAGTRPATPATGSRSTPATGADCHYCGHVLPHRRTVTFCPYCGQNVTVRRCPACSAEADVGWRFCVCCGRGMNG
ncbi:MAG TPA: zinc ribbon domain-containing protein [Gemmatimonadaceae bacterium]|nr:zinc ribbon domain-containing protein [Gemmatimonadaceae bacterium]